MRRVVSWMTVAAVATTLASCSDDDVGVPDGGAPDAGLFPAVPDPDERTDCVTTRPGSGEVLAKHLTCEAELLEGTVAMGRLDRDVLLENAEARFVVRGGDGSATFIGTGAGGLVDAASVGGVDVLKDVLPLADLSSIGAREVVVTEAGGDRAVVRAIVEMEVVGLVAEVVPIAQPVPLWGVIDYELRADDPLLRMTVRLTPMEGESSVRFSPGLAAFVGGATEMLQPGAEGMHLMLEGADSATYVALPEEGNISDVIASINLMQGSDRIEVEQGEVAEYEVRVAVGPTAAHAWNAAHADDAGLAALTLEGAFGDRVEIRRLDGGDEPVALRTRFDENGRAVVHLPPGEYRAVAGFDEWFPGEPVEVSLPQEGASVDVDPAPSGTLEVDATAEASPGGEVEQDAPVRVTVLRKDGGSEVTRFVAIGPTEQRLPPGEYEVSISRGPEFDLHWEGLGEDGLVVNDGDTVAITEVVLPRVVDTAGWVAGDYHLHSEMSTDSRHWLPSALRMLAAEGLEVAAATDHDFTTDYARYAEQAGTEGWVLMIPGSEVSHPVLAHINGFPLQVDPNAHIQGSPPWFGGAPTDWFAALRERGDSSLDPEGPIVQINHPRRSSSAWFRSIDLDRDTGEASVPPTELGLDPATDLNDFSVDAVEVWNRHPTSASGANEETLLDYLALYGHGHRFAMTGNSDSHSAGNPAGSTRTYVRVQDDNRGHFDWTDVAEGFRDLEVTVSAGIFVEAEQVGDVVDGVVPLHVRVQAPLWIDVDETLRIYRGPHPEHVYEVDMGASGGGPGDVVRYDQIVDVPVDDANADFLVVRADGDRGDPVLQHSTLGITNPIDIQ